MEYLDLDKNAVGVDLLIESRKQVHLVVDAS